MYATVKTLSVIALAGSALAAPSNVQRRGAWGGWSGSWGNWGSYGGSSSAAPAAAEATSVWTNWASTATVYVTGNAPATPTPAAPTTAAAVVTPAPSAPAPSAGQFYGAPSAPASDAWSAPASAAPSAAPSSAPAPGSNDGSWQSVVTEWRGKLKAQNPSLKDLAFDNTLIGNAQKTADDSVGGLKHELNPGSFAQVLAPGNTNDFEHVFVGGWLCELPNTPGLDGVCSSESAGWSYEGQTGHAEILTSTSYSKIGCALGASTGVWACDLA